MAEVVSTATLEGYFKEIYADRLMSLVPDNAKLTKKINFQSAKRLGNLYHQPVIVQQSNGVTFAGPDAGAFTLQAPIAMTTKDAQVEGSNIVLRQSISYEAAARAVSSKAAFAQTLNTTIQDLMKSATGFLELSMLYGQTELAVADDSTNTNATTTVVDLTVASFAAGMWVGRTNLKIEFFAAGTDTLTGGDFTITAVDTAARTITVTGSSGDITTLDTALAGSSPTGDQDIFIKTQKVTSVFNVMVGLDKILTNTGTLFNISAATFDLWKSNTISAGDTALSFDTIYSAIARGVERGLDTDVTLYVNPRTWKDLASDLAALSRFDQRFNQNKLTEGTQELEYHSQNGKISVVTHNMVKEGEAFIIPIQNVVRIGAQELSFNNPAVGGRIFRELDDKAGFEIRLYTNQAILLNKPAHAIKITNIVNTV